MPSILDYEVARSAIVAVLVERLGGKVTFSQSDFDSIARKMLLEVVLPDGSFELEVIPVQ
jgi:hypothetical protein